MAKLNALQKIESHEKLCRIMQKLTHDKIHSIEERVKRLEKILLISTGSLISAMGYVIFTLLSKYCLLYTSPSPRDGLLSRMPSSA